RASQVSSRSSGLGELPARGAPQQHADQHTDPAEHKPEQRVPPSPELLAHLVRQPGGHDEPGNDDEHADDDPHRTILSPGALEGKPFDCVCARSLSACNLQGGLLTMKSNSWLATGSPRARGGASQTSHRRWSNRPRLRLRGASSPAMRPRRSSGERGRTGRSSLQGVITPASSYTRSRATEHRSSLRLRTDRAGRSQLWSARAAGSVWAWGYGGGG